MGLFSRRERPVKVMHNVRGLQHPEAARRERERTFTELERMRKTQEDIARRTNEHTRATNERMRQQHAEAARRAAQRARGW